MAVLFPQSSLASLPVSVHFMSS